MKLINQEAVLWGETPHNKEDAVLWIEKAGRVCYRSEDNIVDGSGIKFVSNIWKRKHYSVIEHSNVVLRTRKKQVFPTGALIREKSIFDSKYFNFDIHGDRIYISGNWRAWIEFTNMHTVTDVSIDNFPDKLNNSEYEVLTNENDIPLSLKSITAEFVTDRAVTHELVRHRPVSYSQESQRYVRYGSISFVKPWWLDDSPSNVQHVFNDSCLEAEESYNILIDNGMRAEEARAVLPNCTATKIVVTANINEWKHIFNLRLSKAAYPSIRDLLTPIYDEFKHNNWV